MLNIKVEKVMDFMCYPVYAGDIGTLAYTNPDREIIIHNSLLRAEKKLLEYVLLHEIAHIELEHIYELNMEATDIDYEVEADIWAYQHGADYKTIIEFLEQECSKNKYNPELSGLCEYRLGNFKAYSKSLEISQTNKRRFNEPDTYPL